MQARWARRWGTLSMVSALTVCAVTTGCGPQNGPRVFSADRAADRARLGALVAANVGTAEMGPVTVESAYRWSPVDGRNLLLWVACRGRGDTRSCAIAIGATENGNARVMALEPVGWSVPTLSDGSDRAIILAAGDDGRGPWRQLMMYDRERGDVTFSRRLYADGL